MQKSSISKRPRPLWRGQCRQQLQPRGSAGKTRWRGYLVLPFCSQLPLFASSLLIISWHACLLYSISSTTTIGYIIAVWISPACTCVMHIECLCCYLPLLCCQFPKLCKDMHFSTFLTSIPSAAWKESFTTLHSVACPAVINVAIRQPGWTLVPHYLNLKLFAAMHSHMKYLDGTWSTWMVSFGCQCPCCTFSSWLQQ